MKDNILVSIIIPVYNSSQYIDSCVSRLLGQSIQEIEIILINDGSQDDSRIICEKWEQLDRRIKFIDKNNGGTASARNAGLNVAVGEYIQFLDVDDFISDTKLEEQLTIMMDKQLDVCYTQYAFFKENIDQLQNAPEYSMAWLISYRLALLNRWGIDFSLPIHTFLFKHSYLVHNNILLFDQSIRFREDWNYHLAVAAHNPKIEYYKRCHAYYRQNPSGKTSSWIALSRGNIEFVINKIRRGMFAMLPRLSMELWLIVFRMIKYKRSAFLEIFEKCSFMDIILIIIAILIMPITIYYIVIRNVRVYILKS